MKLIRRSYQDGDTWRIRAFLREVFQANGRREHSWHVARWDHLHWHLAPNCGLCQPMEERVTLWETEAGRIAAVLHPVDPAEAFLQVHPDFRSRRLESEMLSHAEQTFVRLPADGLHQIYAPVDEQDTLRKEVLTRLGYTGRGQTGIEHSRDLAGPVESLSPPPGFVLRSMGGEQEHPARSWASWQAFHPNEPDDDYQGWEWFRQFQAAPLYRRDLDVVAAAPDGRIASFCTAFYDDATRSAVTVLVGTAAPFWRRGLGRAVLAETLQRLTRLGCTRVFAKADDPAAEGLYAALLGPGSVSETWIKEVHT